MNLLKRASCFTLLKMCRNRTYKVNYNDHIKIEEKETNGIRKTT